MIKWIITVKFNSDKPTEESRKHWVAQHSKLAQNVPRLKKYKQSHRVTGAEDIGNAEYHGFESLWFKDEAAAELAMASPEGMALKADLNAFSQPDFTRQFLARELLMRDIQSQENGLKLVSFNFRKPELSPTAFQNYWANSHGPLVMKNFAALGRYVQNPAVLSSYQGNREPAFDGMLEAWLTSFEALGAGTGTPEHESMRADEANFLDADRFSFMLVREVEA